MSKRVLVSIGAISFSLLAVLGIMWFLSPSFSVVYAGPSTAVNNAPLPRPATQASCTIVDHDISVNTTWTNDCYRVMTNTVTVLPTATLTIAPPISGTRVEFMNNARLQVQGQLFALGTDSRPITFTSVNTGCGRNAWLGISLDIDSAGSRIEHSVVECARTGVRTNDTNNVSIVSNTFRYNGNSSTYVGAIAGDTDDSFILSNTIYSCTNGVVLNEAFDNDISVNTIYDIDRYGLAFIADTTAGGNGNNLSDNTIYACGLGGMRLEISDMNNVSGNEIHDCDGDGIHLDDGDFNAVQDNIVYQNGGNGIVIAQQSNMDMPPVQRNDVFSNASSAGAMGGIVITDSQDIILSSNEVFGNALTFGASAGIVIAGDSQNVSLESNQIWSNGSSLGGYVGALYVQDMASSGFVSTLIADSNVIYDTYGAGIYYAAANDNDLSWAQYNAICSLPSFELNNQRVGHTIAAQYGWWSTNAPALGVHYLGSVNVTPHITLSIAGTAGGLVTVRLRDQNGNTVPPPSGRQASPPAPNFRYIRLSSNWGAFSSPFVVVDDQGIGTTNLIAGGAAPVSTIVLTATDWCGYPVTTAIDLPDLAIAKDVAVSSVTPGDLLTYTLAYSNAGAGAASDVYITDTLSTGVSYVADTCGLPLTFLPGGALRWYVGDLLPSESHTCQVTVQVAPDIACGTLALAPNQVDIGTASFESNLLNNHADSPPVALVWPDVTVGKTTVLTQVLPGELVTYTISYGNVGLGDAEGVSLDDVLPPWTTYVADTSGLPCAACIPGTTGPLIWAVGHLSAGAASSFELVLQANGSSAACEQPLTNTVSITTTTPECGAGPNQAQNPAVSIACPELATEKFADPPQGSRYAPITFTIAYTNAGNLPVSNAVITDWLPANTSYVSDDSGLSCPACVVGSTGPLVWTIPLLQPGQSFSFDLHLSYDAHDCGVLLTNTVSVGSAMPEAILNNNWATATYYVEACPDPAVIKSDNVGGTMFSQRAGLTAAERAEILPLLRLARAEAPSIVTQGAFVYEGNLITYTIFAWNQGTLTATNVVLTETLPLYTEYVDTGYGWVQVDSRTYILNVGTIPPNTVVYPPYQFVVHVVFPLPDAAGDLLSNRVCIRSDDVIFDPHRHCDEVLTEVRRYPMRVFKAAPGCIVPGSWFEYTITYQNRTTDTMFSNVVVTDTLDTYITYAGSPADGWACTGPICNQTIPSVPAGVSGTLNLPVQLSAAFPYPARTTFTNVVEIEDGNRFVLATPIYDGPDVAIAKYGTTLSGTVHPGDRIVYRILYANLGLGAMSNAVLTETLPEYTGYYGYGWTSVGGRTYAMNLGDLSPGEAGEVEFIVQVDASLPPTLTWIYNAVEIGGTDPECNTDNNRAEYYLPVEGGSPPTPPDFALSKDGPPFAMDGDTITYTIVATNTGAAANVTLSDPVPNGSVYIPNSCTYRTSEGDAGPCGPPPDLWQGNLNAGERITVTFSVQAQVSAPNWPLNNCATLDWSSGSIMACYLTSINPQGINLTVIKDDSVGGGLPVQFVYEGGTVTYTVAVTNTGAVTATNVVLTETLPLYTDYVGYSWTHLGGSTYITPVGTLSPGEERVYYFVVRVQEALPAGVDNIVNVVCGGGDEQDYYPADNCSQEDTPVRPRPLRVSKSADVCMSPGDEFNYYVTYQNTTTDTTFTNVTLADTLDAYVSYIGGPEWTCIGQTCSRVIPTVPPGVSVTLLLPARLSAAFPYPTRTTITNTVEISGGNTFTLVTPIDSTPDLAIVKNDNVVAASIAPGERITYTIIYANGGLSAATNVVLTEHLPDYTTYVGGGWTSAGGGLYTMSLGDLASGQGGFTDFVVRVDDPFPAGVSWVVNEVEINSDSLECNTDNNRSFEDTLIANGFLTFTLQKSGPPTAYPNSIVTYTIVAVNNGAPESGVTLSDTVPGGAALVPGSCTYQINGGAPQPCGLPPTLWQEDMATGDRITTTFAVQVTVGSMGSVVQNCAALDWSSDSITSCVQTMIVLTPTLVKTAPPTVCPTGTLTYTIVAANSTGIPMLFATLADPTPPGATYTPGSCTYSVNGGAPQLCGSPPTLWQEDLQVGDVVTTTFAAQVTAGSVGQNIQNCATLDWNGVQVQACANTTVAYCGQTPLYVTKSAPPCISPGDLFPYAITYTNYSTDTAAFNVVLTDTLDAYVIYAGGPEWSCVGQICSRTVPTIPPGTSGALLLPVRLSAAFPYPTRTTITNTIEISGGNTFVLVSPLDSTPDLAIVKNDNVGITPVGPGELITYTIIYINGGISAATNVVLTEYLPNDTAYVGGGWTLAGGGLYTMSVGDLPPGQGGLVNFSVRVDDPVPAGVFWAINEVEIDSDSLECNTSNNRSFEQTPISTTVPLTFTLQKSGPATAYPNSIVTYTIVAVNNGPFEPGVTLTDPIPNGTAFVPGSCTYHINGGAPQPCGLPPDLWQEDMATGDRITTTFAVQVTVGSMGWIVQNCATLDWISDTATSCVHTIVVPPIDLELIKIGPAAVCPTETITYTIVATNNTGIPALGVILTDSIPFGTVYVPGSCTYSVNGGPPQPCGPPPTLWQEDMQDGDVITTTFAVQVMIGSMGWVIQNCAILDWNGVQIQACTDTTVARCDQRLYVANRGSGTVDIFNLTNFNYMGTIPLTIGSNPFGMAFDDEYLFVAEFEDASGQGRLYTIDTRLDTIVDSIVVGVHPIHIAVYDNHVYVASHSSRPAITVVDVLTIPGTIVAQPELDRYRTYEFGMFGATSDVSRGSVYLSKRDFGSFGIWSITPPLPGNPWVADYVYQINQAFMQSECAPGIECLKPHAILYHPLTDRVYMAMGLISELWVLDPDTWTLLERIPTETQDPSELSDITQPGYGGHGLAALGQCIFVSNYISHSVTAVVGGNCEEVTGMTSNVSAPYEAYLPLIIKGTAPTQRPIQPQQLPIVTIPLSGRPKGMAAGAGHYLFVTIPEYADGTPGLDRVAVIDTRTLMVVQELSVTGSHPHTIILGARIGAGNQMVGTLVLP